MHWIRTNRLYSCPNWAGACLVRWGGLGLALILGCEDVDRALSDKLDSEQIMGSWDVGNCQDDIVYEAQDYLQVDQIVPDFELENQFGESLRLYDFCHKTVLVEFVSAKQDQDGVVADAERLQGYYEKYAEQGLMVIAVLNEGWDDQNLEEDPSLSDLKRWSDLAESTHPVLADPGAEIFKKWQSEREFNQGGYNWPRTRLITPGMILNVLYPDPTWEFTEQMIIDALPKHVSVLD